jgi:hypothetical protein
MTRTIAFLILLMASAAGAATGAIKWATVETNGWVLEVCFENMATNQAFTFGWDSLNRVCTNPITVVISSLGYDTAGNTTTRARTLRCTKQLRFPYGAGGQTTANYINDVQANQTTNAVARIALSDYVYSGDTITSVAVAASMYGANLAAASVAALTNSSTQAYPHTIIKDNWPQWERITNSTYKLHIGAYNRFGMNGTPVACVVVTSTDNHEHNVFTTVTRPTIDRTLPDAKPIVEFVATVDASTLTSGDIITNTFRAYPWIGDSTSIGYSGDGKFTIADPYWHTNFMLCDTDNAHGTVRAFVNETNGTANGKAVPTNWTFGAEPAAFASIDQACHAIQGTNSILYGHNDSSGGYVQIAGTASFCGTAGSLSATAGKTYLTICAAPGYTATLKDGTGVGNPNNKLKLQDLTITSADAFTFSAISNIWFNRVTFNVPNSSGDLIDGSGFHWATDCTVTAFDQGFLQQGSQNTCFELVRGTAINGKCPSSHIYNFIGNTHTTTNAFVLNSAYSGIPRPVQSAVVAFNKFSWLDEQRHDLRFVLSVG